MTEDGPRYCDVRDAKARERHRPFSCPDKTLTAFCQLGALRLKARRCLLFFFDVNYAYAMAEATQSLSLENDDAHDVNDQLWLGHAKIPRNVACCEVTVGLPSFSPSSSTMNGQRDSVYIVDDLTKNPQTWDRPYVTAFPHGRFYAGVPITAPSGINIGAYCVLDDEPRNSLSEKDLTFLRDMARTVMTHLETVRAQAERERATHMVTGLGAFVKRSSDSRRWDRRSPVTSVARSPSIVVPNERKGLTNRGSYRSVKRTAPAALTGDATSIGLATINVSRSEHVDPRRPRTSYHSSPLTNTTDQADIADRTDGSPSISSKVDFVSRRPRKQTTPAPRPPMRRSHSVMNVQSIYQRAAEIMCNSLSVDGVAFVDASVRTFGGLAETIDSAGATDASTCEESETASDKSRPATPSTYTKGNPCQLLGCAESLQSEPAESVDGQPATKMTDSFLRQLLRRHPHGKIWSFSKSGQAHSEDSSSSSGNDDSQEADAPDHSRSASVQQRRRRKIDNSRDAEVLATIFPGARSVAVHGIRDAARRRWTAGCILWSYDPLRVLTTDTEMNLVAAFCDIIAGETRRLEIQRSDKAKSDFISSISHELRSPLHGILGSTEVLKDLDLSSMASALTGQIDSCGRTLLDIIDHLLDFATIKGQRIEKGAVSSTRIRRSNSLQDNKASANDDIADVAKSVALDDLTEEAVESTVYSFNCKKGTDFEPRTSVILAIDRSVVNQWHCNLATGGWRRICINLVTNALKYTPCGYIHVSLSQRSRPGSKCQFEAILNVTDSGKGMSKEFLDNHLFRDFAQEDTLADGIGLGMHMVGRIVNAIGAKIDVSSEQEGPKAGTSVTVTVPLEHSQEHRNVDNMAEPSSKPPSAALAGLNVGIIGDRSAPHPEASREEQLMFTANTLAIESLERICTELGLQSHTGDLARCNLNIVFEAEFEFLVRATNGDVRHNHLSGKPCMVICNSNPSSKTLKASQDEAILQMNSAIEYVAMPCGAKSISRAAMSALVRQKEIDALSKARNGEKDRPLVVPSMERTNVEEGEVPPSIHSMPTAQELPIRSKIEKTRLTPEETNAKPRPAAQEDRVQQFMTSARNPSKGEQANDNTSAAAGSPKSVGPTLLLVDDNKVNLQLLTMYAKKRAYAYLEATDGQKAVDAYTKAHEDTGSTVPSVILMDINMPVMDGYEATQHIRAYERKHQLPSAKIIALTALGSEAAYQEAFGSGCDMFLTKPVKLKDLTQIIEEM